MVRVYMRVHYLVSCSYSYYHNKKELGLCLQDVEAHSTENSLTHLRLNKMTTILADDIFKCIFLNENDWIPIRISLKFNPRSPIDNKPALVWRRPGDKPLPEPLLAQFTDAYMRHQEEMS